MSGPAGNPLTWGKGGGSYSASDAAAEMGAVYTDHIPTTLAGVLIVSGLVLYALKKANFRFVTEGSVGRG